MNDDEALKDKAERLFSEQEKRIGMTPISAPLAANLENLRKKVSAAPVTLSALPRSPRWARRRFFCVQSGDGRRMAIWVDDGCEGQHVAYELHDGTGEYLGRKDWHSYQDGQGRAFAIRCPASLTTDESARVQTDEPSGHWRAVLRDYAPTKRGGYAEPAESLE